MISAPAAQSRESARQASGQFGTQPHQEAAGVTLVPNAPSDHRLQELATARESIFHQWNDLRDTAPDSPLFETIDALHQRASVQLAAAAVLTRHPDAETLVVRENEDGENQYDILRLEGRSGSIDHSVDSPLIEGELNPGGPDLDESLWSLNLKDDGWALGIAEDISDPRNGKMFRIDLAAALGTTISTMPAAHR
ncbi:hypothetical protein [Arthrobacter sp. A2-55]|uniref:hypothetical protein n=1 Tax=Arthrobacter sp. A2-55 TaxID=2897337 RepID=UPI0021CD86D5|nr:hypothetical protein [Arthrobacter sp. A2-55]MCU6480555.1 hypothetical protein [Arthrobacter sp. A2-55]